MTKLKNYTSSIPVEKTLAKIESLLVEAGAHAISRSYENKAPFELRFLLTSNGTTWPFRLKANAENVWRAMVEDHQKTLVRPIQDKVKESLREQAAKTAWKLIADLVEVQVSLFRIGQVEALEIFLHALCPPDAERSLYEVVRDGGGKALKQLTS